MLERSVSEAQGHESRVSNLQNWIETVNELLNDFIEHEIEHEDVPHDFQVFLTNI
jgi:hypothetical protein